MDVQMSEETVEHKFLQIRGAAQQVLLRIERPQGLTDPMRRLHLLLKGRGALGEAVQELNRVLANGNHRVISPEWLRGYLKALGDLYEVAHAYVHQGEQGG